MKRHSFAASLLAIGLLSAAAVRPRDDIDMTEEERKTPPRDPEPAPTPTNLPGETNRQFAARMKAEDRP